jgi:hypothetical protein
MPWDQPGITWSSEKVTGWPSPSFHEASNCWPVDQATPTYWTVTLSPGATAAPVPVMRSVLSRPEGGVPVGTVTVGLVPNDPAGEGSWTAVTGTVDAGAVAAVEGAEVLAVADGDELLQPARPTAATARARRATVRRRDIVTGSFRDGGSAVPGSTGGDGRGDRKAG